MAQPASSSNRKSAKRWIGARKAAGKPSLNLIVDPSPQQSPIPDPVSSPKNAGIKAASVVTATLPPVHSRHDKLVGDAAKVAAAVNRLIEEKDDQIENRSRDLIRLMLIVRESFKDQGTINEEAFWQFVDRQAGPVRGKLKNRWQRLAKVCVPRETKRPQVSKYGYVLAALVKEGIGSDTVMEEFEAEAPVAGSERDYTGMDRFVRLYKANIPGPAKDANPFMTMEAERLRERAELLIDALRAKHLLNPEIEDVSDLMR
ncbi:hypothetical protein PUR23_29820 [Methylorubrum populi]|jgi:hypothetical protein|uniref:hypothetical protein n=1 Tax=Methylorubrum populi TaxID=223967 RepID=UPI0031F885CA